MYQQCINLFSRYKFPGANMGQIVHSKIQKWGNGLAIRVAGLVRDIPKFEKDTPVDIEIFEDGFTVRKVKQKSKGFKFPISEQDLLKDLNANTAHSDELVKLIDKEINFE